MDHVFHYPFLPWDMDHVLRHCPFSSYHLPWITTTNKNYHLLSQNPHHTLPLLRRHIHKPWDWAELAQNIAFAPHRVYPYKNELPLWRWDLSLRNPRLTWAFYHLIRKEITIPHQFHHLLKNHFHHATPFLLYFALVVRRFLVSALLRRRILRKLRLLVALKSHLDPHLLRSILLEYIG
jgi:hypothetical protein